MKQKRTVLFNLLLLLILQVGCTSTSINSTLPEPAIEPSPTPRASTSGPTQSPDPSHIFVPVPEEPTGQLPEPPKPEPWYKEESLEVYRGPVEHIFFHPLIAYPERAFDGDRLSKGYQDWFVTVPEFQKIVEALYENNYMLVDINMLYEEADHEGKTVMQRKELKLPKGKKPLILSVDDLNYYTYMIENGNASKLILDDNRRIATYSLDLQGKEVISYENEIVPIVDDFVIRHPDFSFDGAKGILALTGYEGVLGYRTNDSDPKRAAEEKEAALPIIERLKQTGWSFASHGWGHLDANRVDYDRLVKDTERWKREVEPLIGPTPVYIYPYGSRVETDGDKFRYLAESGFRILCSVGPTPYLKYNANAVMMDRRHIDGLALESQRDRLLDMFDSLKVIDPIRQKLTSH